MTLVIFKYCVGPNSISYKKCVHTPLGYGEDSAQGHMRFRGRLKLHIPNFNGQNIQASPYSQPIQSKSQVQHCLHPPHISGHYLFLFSLFLVYLLCILICEAQSRSLAQAGLEHYIVSWLSPPLSRHLSHFLRV